MVWFIVIHYGTTVFYLVVFTRIVKLLGFLFVFSCIAVASLHLLQILLREELFLGFYYEFGDFSLVFWRQVL